MSLDLAQFDTKVQSDEGSVLMVRNPITLEQLMGDDDKPVWIRLAGPDSVKYKQAERAAINDRLRRRAMQATADELENDHLNKLTACTLDWSGNFTVKGRKPELTHDDIKFTYRELSWLREQVGAWLENRLNFFSTSKNGSSSLPNGTSSA